MSGNTPVLLQKHVLPTPWMAVQTVDRVEHDAGGQNSTVSRYYEGVIWPPELPLHPTRGSENKTLPSGHSLDLGCRLGPEDVFSAGGRVGPGAFAKSDSKQRSWAASFSCVSQFAPEILTNRNLEV